MKPSLIIALDFSSKDEVKKFLTPFHHERLFLKIGMELYYQEGPAIVYELKELGHKIFLDLKLHDIPQTVYRAMKGIGKLGVDLVNVHAAGGKEMMELALIGLQEGTPSGQSVSNCIAVTQLTSTSEKQMEEEQLIHVPLQQSVLHYARLAKASGLVGVVCSPHELSIIRQEFGHDFITVTPGIRLQNSSSDDQKRVATPQFARREGATAIVVGRGITRSSDPLQSYYKYKQGWEEV